MLLNGWARTAEGVVLANYRITIDVDAPNKPRAIVEAGAKIFAYGLKNVCKIERISRLNLLAHEHKTEA